MNVSGFNYLNALGSNHDIHQLLIHLYEVHAFETIAHTPHLAYTSSECNAFKIKEAQHAM